MIRREISIFLVVGTLTVLVDFLTYRGLFSMQCPVDVAKGISFVCGTVFAYFANRFWTFGHKQPGPGSVQRFALLYALTLAANVSVNAAMLMLLSKQAAWALQIAFLSATAVSASMNFVGMKLFVFRGSREASVA